MSSKIHFSTDLRGVATVRLNQPDIHNAFDDEMIASLSQAFAQVEDDNSIRMMVLAAAGKSFSAGGDLNWMRRMVDYSEAENLADAQALAAMLYSLNSLSKPTIARVQGAAFGGAVGLVSCCDIAVGTVSSKFCLSEVKIGLLPATISPYVIAAIGARAARRYFQTAEVIDAAKALQLDLLSDIVEPEQLDDRIDEFCSILLANAPSGMTAAKRLVSDLAHQTIDDKLMLDTSKRIAAKRISAEGQEGLSAFLEKRAATWQPKR